MASTRHRPNQAPRLEHNRTATGAFDLVVIHILSDDVVAAPIV